MVRESLSLWNKGRHRSSKIFGHKSSMAKYEALLFLLHAIMMIRDDKKDEIFELHSICSFNEIIRQAKYFLGALK